MHDLTAASRPFAWYFAHARDNVGAGLIGVFDFDTFAAAIRAGVEQCTVPGPPSWDERALNDAKRALPGFGPYVLRGDRCNENVSHFSSLVWDIDHMAAAESAELIEVLRGAGLRGFMYESPSSGLKGPDPRYRLVLAVDRPVLPHEWAPIKARVAALLRVKFDPAAEKLSQIAFVGRFAGTPARRWLEFPGMPIPVNDEIGAAPVAPVAAPRGASASYGAQIEHADLLKLARLLQRKDPASQAPTIGLMIEKALSGQRYASDGARHVWNVRLGYVLGANFKHTDPYQIAEHFAAALSLQRGKSVDEFAELIASGQRKAQIKDEMLDGVMRALDRTRKEKLVLRFRHPTPDEIGENFPGQKWAGAQ